MNDLNALVSLDYVVASLINVTRIDERDFVHIKQIVIEGYQELCMFHLNNVKVAYPAIETGNIVTLPPDFMYYSKIGVVVDGKVHTLSLDDTIPLTRDMSCGEDVEVTGSQVNYTNEYAALMNLAPSYFADTGTNVGKYRIDEERRIIQLTGCSGYTNIVLEYATVPIQVGEDTMVKRYVVPALRAYAAKMMVHYDVRVRDNEKERRHQDWMAEVYKLRQLENGLTADEYKDIINSTKKQTVKR